MLHMYSLLLFPWLHLFEPLISRRVYCIHCIQLYPTVFFTVSTVSTVLTVLTVLFRSLSSLPPTTSQLTNSTSHPPHPTPPHSPTQIKYVLPDPVANDVKYQASAQPFLVLGLLTTGLAIGHHNAALDVLVQ